MTPAAEARLAAVLRAKNPALGEVQLQQLIAERAAVLDERDTAVLEALKAWRGGRGVGDPRPAQLAALAAGPQLDRRQVSAALQRLKAAGLVLRTHLGWELPPAPPPPCAHKRLRSEVLDQTLGVVCTDCNLVLGYCWAGKHLPEELWNRACQNDLEATPTAQSRPDVCAICEQKIEAEEPSS